MKKILTIMVLLCSILLSSCKPSYEDEAGLYELYFMEGAFSMDMYEFYTIELFEDGTVRIQSKSSEFGSAVYDVTTEYSIKNGKITIITKVGFSNLKEVYDYVDGEIHMINAEIPGTEDVLTAKFRRS
jgi:hypothetical protein